MNITRFPIEEVSADYGDIILDSVTDNVDTSIRINGVVVLQELYTPDISGTVAIRDLGSLAMNYYIYPPMSLDNGLDGQAVVLDISLTEGTQVFSSSITIYRCDAESGDTLAVDTLRRMPLSRTTKKITGVGRTEFISFYGGNSIKVDIAYMGAVTDENRTIDIGTVIADENKFYSYNVSPSVIAGLIDIQETDLISYRIYSSADDSILYAMERRAFPNKKTFFFRNIFGAKETITCTGDSDSERKWTRNFGTVNKYQVLLERNMDNTYTVNTGYLYREAAEVLECLLNSQELFLFEDGRLHRVTVLEESFKVSARRDQLIAIEFKYRYASNNHVQYRTNKKRIFDFTFDETFN